MQDVQVPAVVLMIVAGLNALMQLVSLALNMLSIGVSGIAASAGGSAAQQNLIAGVLSGSISVIGALIGLAASGVIFFGAWKMYRMESYAWAMSAAALSCVPCFSCCCVGLPVGVWALIVLNTAGTREMFAT